MGNYSVQLIVMNIKKKKDFVAITKDLEAITKKYKAHWEILLNPDKKEDIPLLYQHDPKNVIGHAVVENCDDGIRVTCVMNKKEER